MLKTTRKTFPLLKLQDFPVEFSSHTQKMAKRVPPAGFPSEPDRHTSQCPEQHLQTQKSAILPHLLHVTPTQPGVHHLRAGQQTAAKHEKLQLQRWGLARERLLFLPRVPGHTLIIPKGAGTVHCTNP